MAYVNVSKGPAVTTQYEALLIDQKVIKNVVSAPELAQAPERVDATTLSSPRRSYIPGVPDYGEELTWVVNAQINDNPQGNLSRLKALDPDTAYQVERRLLGANVRCIFRGYVRWSLGGASVNGIQTITITVTPTTKFTFSTHRKDPDTGEGTTMSGHHTLYYGYCIIDGERVYLQADGADVGDSTIYIPAGYIHNQDAATASLSGIAGQMHVGSLEPPEGYEFRGWCEDAVGEGRIYQPGEAHGDGCVRTDLWPVLVPVQPQASLASPLVAGGLQGPMDQEAQGLSVVRPYFEDGSDAEAGEDPENEAEEAPEDADGEILEDNDAEEGPE